MRFIVTEFIDGESLRERIARSRIDIDDALDIAIQVATALVAAHKAKIAHRDIKPENIMIRRDDGIVKVLDFGLAKATERLRGQAAADSNLPTVPLVNTSPGVVMGTVGYMSPEQARGANVDERTDIWSLGCVLYEMVAGCVPFVGASANEVLSAVLSKEKQPPLARYAHDVPERLEEIVTKALTKDRDERYQTVKDMLIDLKRLKQKREVEGEIERTASPDRSVSANEDVNATTINIQVGRSSTAETPADATIALLSHPTSSAEYIVTQIRTHKRGVYITLGVLLIAAATLSYFFYFKGNHAPVLTEKDTILLADFVNTTGDAAFDGTLKQALAIQLEQSPFLNIFSDERVRETLRFMNRSPDDRVTKDVAREICQRQGLKAYFAGSISNLGSHLVITLEAVNAQTGDTLARQQVEAESKEQVLSALGRAATKVREKLGESLGSIQKYDAPIEATTSSLEALKAYSLGKEQNGKGKSSDAIPLFKRAVELDPNFARAYTALAVNYNNIGQRQLAVESAQKAFDLRDRTSEKEKLLIALNYYVLVTGELERSIETLELMTRTYPRDFLAHHYLGFLYLTIGQCEKAVEEEREAIRLDPSSALSYLLLATAFRCLNRFDEAKQIYEQALAQKLDITAYHADLYTIAFVRGDTAAMQQQLDWARGKPDEYEALFWQAETAAYLGELRKARELANRLADAELGRNLKENAADTMSGIALMAAVTGNCQQAREDVARASALPRTDTSFFGIGIGLAQCGELSQAQSVADEFAKRRPKDTLINAIALPAIRAAIEIRRNNPAQAIQFLQSANRYDRTGDYWPQYLRGQAYLTQGAGAEAATEFQKILDRRGLAPTSVLYPLAHLGIARAAVLSGDTAKARKSYQDFFAIWKDADADLPVLIEAKKEYEHMKTSGVS
jgi:tetratricopeptide (TPR) repeat protein